MAKVAASAGVKALAAPATVASAAAATTTSETALCDVEHTWTLRHVYRQLLCRAAQASSAYDVFVPSPVFGAGNWWWQLRAILQCPATAEAEALSTTDTTAPAAVTLAALHRRHAPGTGAAVAGLPAGVRLLVSLYLCGARDASTAAATAGLQSLHATWAMSVGDARSVRTGANFPLPQATGTTGRHQQPPSWRRAQQQTVNGYGLDLGALPQAVVTAVRDDTLRVTVWLTVPKWSPSPGLRHAPWLGGSTNTDGDGELPPADPDGADAMDNATTTPAGADATTPAAAVAEDNGSTLRNAFYHLLPGAAIALQSGLNQFVTAAYKPEPGQQIFEQCDSWEATFVYSLVFGLCFVGAMLTYKWSKRESPPPPPAHGHAHHSTEATTADRSASGSSGGGELKRVSAPSSTVSATGCAECDAAAVARGDGDATDTDVEADAAARRHPRPRPYRISLGFFRALVVLSWLVLPTPFPLICWVPYMDATKYQTMTIFQGILFVFIAWGCPVVAHKCFYAEEFDPPNANAAMEWANCECCDCPRDQCTSCPREGCKCCGFTCCACGKHRDDLATSTRSSRRSRNRAADRDQ